MEIFVLCLWIEPCAKLNYDTKYPSPRNNANKQLKLREIPWHGCNFLRRMYFWGRGGQIQIWAITDGRVARLKTQLSSLCFTELEFKGTGGSWEGKWVEKKMERAAVLPLLSSWWAQLIESIQLLHIFVGCVLGCLFVWLQFFLVSWESRMTFQRLEEAFLPRGGLSLQMRFSSRSCTLLEKMFFYGCSCMHLCVLVCLSMQPLPHLPKIASKEKT